jgi:hypothetical protein
MSHLNMLHFEGDAEDLLSRKQRHLDPVTARVGPQAGGLVHITAKTPDGLLVLNLMADSDGQQNASMHPDVVQALRDSGLPAPKVERYDVARFVLAPAAAEATTA